MKKHNFFIYIILILIIIFYLLLMKNRDNNKVKSVPLKSNTLNEKQEEIIDSINKDLNEIKVGEGKNLKIGTIVEENRKSDIIKK